MTNPIRIWEPKLELKLYLMSLDKLYKKNKSNLILLTIRKLQV
jgi:hypothetical protein